ncbi:hypothetical protein [Streptomyces sp. NPDC058157]|uniref:hypothetical protein n=1 Tax=Streptomyces sp. NPDC058157 TaxID=3346360 RepID=UPI0036EC03EB
MNTDYWTVLDDSERDQWAYSPRRTVGPLTFGTERDEAVATMAAHGYTAEQSHLGTWQRTSRSEWRVAFGKPESRWGRPAVKCYFVEGVGLTCVLVDGLLGPQVTHAGMRLIGRVPSELAREAEAYADRHGAGLRASLGGDLYLDGCELELGAQRAGDSVVTWALFFHTADIAGTSWDIAPAEVWRHW